MIATLLRAIATELRALRRWIAGQTLCRWHGCDYPSASYTFDPNYLYFCRRCGKELLGRDWGRHRAAEPR